MQHDTLVAQRTHASALDLVTEYWYVFRAMTPMNARTDSPVMTVTRVPPRFALSQAQELQWLS